MQARRVSLICALIALFAFAVAPAVGDPTFPELDVYTYHQAVGKGTDLDLALVVVPSAPAAESAALTVPASYKMLTSAVGATLGAAEIDARPSAGGQDKLFRGTITAADPATLTTNPQVQACAPGAHAAAWNLLVTGFTVPVTVDPIAGGGYKLVVCLDVLRTQSLKPVEVYLATTGVFVNPSAAGTYAWSGLVTPFTAAGTPDPTTAYEVRGDESLPQSVTLKAAYNSKSRTMTLSGKLSAASKARARIRVHIYSGTTKSLQLKQLKVVVTNSSGSYVFKSKTSRPPKYVSAHVFTYYSLTCNGGSTAPGGCQSETTDGTDGVAVKVPQPVKKR